MKEEHAMAEEPEAAMTVGFVTFLSFVTVGIVPLVAYLADHVFELDLESPFIITIVLAALAFAGIGWLKSRVAHAPVFRSVLETLSLGLVASGASYYIGKWLETLVS
jgi:VIT1/CCC1 family predicted Fe2+/Mn2+ transporter